MDEFDRIVATIRVGSEPLLTSDPDAVVRPFEIGLHDFERRAFETTALMRRYLH